MHEMSRIFCVDDHNHSKTGSGVDPYVHDHKEMLSLHRLTVIYCCTCSFDTRQALRNQNSHPSTAMEGTSNNRTQWTSTLSHLIPAGQFSLQAGILLLEGYLNDHSSISRALPRSDEIKCGFKLFNLWQTLIPSTAIATISCIKTTFNRDLSQAYMYRETAKALPIRKPLWLLLWWSNSSTHLTEGWYTVQPWSIELLEGFQNQKDHDHPNWSV